MRKCGEVTYTDAHYRSGEGRGEVCFSDREGMERCLDEMDGHEINQKARVRNYSAGRIYGVIFSYVMRKWPKIFEIVQQWYSQGRININPGFWPHFGVRNILGYTSLSHFGKLKKF